MLFSSTMWHGFMLNVSLLPYQAKRNADARLMIDLHYFDGECPNPATQQQIKENAVQIFRSSYFGQACNCDITADDFQVTCGAINKTIIDVC